MARWIGRMQWASFGIGQWNEIVAVASEHCGGRLRGQYAAVERITLLTGDREVYQGCGFLRTRGAVDEPFLQPTVLERARHDFGHQHLDHRQAERDETGLRLERRRIGISRIQRGFHLGQYQRGVEKFLEYRIIVNVFREIAPGAQIPELRIRIATRYRRRRAVLNVQPRPGINPKVTWKRGLVTDKWHRAIAEWLDEELRDVRPD